MTTTIGSPCTGCGKPDTLRKITSHGSIPICQSCHAQCDLAWGRELRRIASDRQCAEPVKLRGEPDMSDDEVHDYGDRETVFEMMDRLDESGPRR